MIGELLMWLFFQPLLHLLHATFALLYPSRTVVMARLKQWTLAVLALIACCLNGSIVLLWLRVFWVIPLALFVTGCLACHLLDGLADQLDAEAATQPRPKSTHGK
ncbi:MAG: hypothetical protein WD872_20985 [Pirellulaceae bacterium]